MIETIISEVELIANSRHFEIVNRIINEIEKNNNKPNYDGDIIADTKKALIEYVNAKVSLHRMKKRNRFDFVCDNVDVDIFSKKYIELQQKRIDYYKLRELAKEIYGIVIK